jgi:hypothetical protein
MAASLAGTAVTGHKCTPLYREGMAMTDTDIQALKVQVDGLEADNEALTELLEQLLTRLYDTSPDAGYAITDAIEAAHANLGDGHDSRIVRDLRDLLGRH